MQIRIVTTKTLAEQISAALNVKSHPRRGSSDRSIYLNSPDPDALRKIAVIIEESQK